MNSQLRAAVLAVLLLPLSQAVFAQSVEMPQTVTVSVGRLAVVPMTYEGDDFQYVVPSDLDAFREYTTDPKEVRLRVIGYRPGIFTIVAVAAKIVDGTDGKPVARMSRFTTCLVQVGNPTPGPGPGPGPGPDPGPGPVDPPPGPKPVILPDGKYKLAQVAYDNAIKLPSGLHRHLPKLTDNYKTTAAGVRAQIAAGVSPSVVDVLESLRRKNRTAVGADPATGAGGDAQAMLPWFTAWQKQADQFGAQGNRTLMTSSDYATAFDETAAGLEAAVAALSLNR